MSKWTKEYRAEYMKKWREENKERVKECRHEYYMRSLLNGKYVPPTNAHNRENARRWRENNREKYNEYHRDYYARTKFKSVLDKSV
jgi:hypothetical protein